jgi:UDP-glucose 4-epimerase
VIYASTGGAVYGHCGDAPVTEDVKPDPVGFYGIGKLAAEMYVRKAATEAGCDYAIMRIGNAFGPGQLEDNLSVGFVARAVEAALHDSELTVWGADEIYRDYIHADDVASAFAAVVVKAGLLSGIYNVGCGKGYSGREVVRLVEKSLGRKISINEKPAREFDVRRVSLDASSLRQQTGWVPEFSLAEGIADLAKVAVKLR